MTGVFSGGLVYEFTQEPNNYGLVKVQSNGNITLLPDFLALKEQFDALEEFEPEVEQRKSPFETKAKNDQSRLKFQKFGLPQCEKSYENLDTSKGLPKSLAKGLINKGILVERGKYVDLSEEQLETKFRVFSPKGDPYDINLSIETVVDIMSGTEMKRTRKPRVPHKCKYINIFKLIFVPQFILIDLKTSKISLSGIFEIYLQDTNFNLSIR